MENRGVFIFGAGKKGQMFSSFLRKYGMEYLFVDNDESKCGREIGGTPVVSIEELLKKRRGERIVICCSNKNYDIIEKQLLSLGLENEKDFCRDEYYVNRVLPRELFVSRGCNMIGLCQISLTERCTLRCKNCAHGCYAVDNNTKDLSFSEIKESVDIFFSLVDVVYEFVLIGGEPFLYGELEKVISYIGEHYGERMFRFTITTNGTITPKDSVLEVCKKNNVIIEISNYSATIPRLEMKLEELILKLSQNEVCFELGNEDHTWIDYGFGKLDRKASVEELRRVFAACHTPCHELRENRLYFCVMARSVSENLKMNVGKEDYLDLSSLKGVDGKEKINRFIVDGPEKGYLEMCNYCRGAEAVFYPIPPAEQVK